MEIVVMPDAGRSLLGTLLPAADALHRAFHLTPAECDLALMLLEGMTLAEIGERLDKRVTTLRSQLRSLFTKTGTRRQAALVLRLQSVVQDVS